MKDFLKNLMGFISKAFSNQYIILTMVVIVMILFISNINTCDRLKKEKDLRKQEKEMFEQNLRASNDSIRKVFDSKIGEMSEKFIYLSDNVETINKQMNTKFNEIKGTIAAIDNEIALIIPTLKHEINSDDVIVNKEDTTIYKIPFTFNTSDAGFNQHLVGYTSLKIDNNKPTHPIYTNLDVNSINVKLKYNFVEENGVYRVNAYSPSPLVSFTEMDGALMIKKPDIQKKNRWSLGVNGGYGINTDSKLDNIRWGWSINAGISYSLF